VADDAKNLALIINTASYERVVFALGMAAAGLALSAKVGLLFTNAGIVRLKKNAADAVAEETASWLRESTKKALGKGHVARISELIKEIRELGGTIYACPAAMAYHNLSRDELIDEVERIRGVTEFLRTEAEGASIIYV
jgi:peroxiredoxin family protein